MNLFFRQVGTGQPIIILHGVFGSSDNWLTIQKTIADQDFAVYALDARNHGRSPHSTGFSYDLMASDLAEFIEEYQIHEPIIIGHSMGGKVAMQFAMTYPKMFKKLIVVDIAPRFYPIHHDHILRGLNAIPLKTLTNRNEAESILSEYESNPAVRQFLLKNLYRDEAGQFAWRINLPVIAQEIHNIGTELSNHQIVSAPTLFLRGSESGYIADEDFEMIRQLFSNVEFQTIEGAGHWVQADKPQAFIDSILKFVK